MAEVAAKLILTHSFEQYVKLGVDKIVVTAGYKTQDITSYYGDEFADAVYRAWVTVSQGQT